MKQFILSNTDDVEYDFSNLQNVGVSIYMDEENNCISKYIKFNKYKYKVTLGKDNNDKYCLLLGYEYFEAANENDCGCKDRKKCIFHLTYLKIIHKKYEINAKTFDKALSIFNKIR